MVTSVAESHPRNPTQSSFPTQHTTPVSARPSCLLPHHGSLSSPFSDPRRRTSQPHVRPSEAPSPPRFGQEGAHNCSLFSPPPLVVESFRPPPLYAGPHPKLHHLFRCKGPKRDPQRYSLCRIGLRGFRRRRPDERNQRDPDHFVVVFLPPPPRPHSLPRKGYGSVRGRGRLQVG